MACSSLFAVARTPKEAFTRTRDLLTSVKSHLLGVVLNAVDASAPDYYYSYRYYPYSYGYGPQEALDPLSEESPATRPRSILRTATIPRNSKEAACAISLPAALVLSGSHLAERLLKQGERVVLLDNLSTGSMENIRHLKGFRNTWSTTSTASENRQLLAELVDDADVIIHLAAAVGVKLIVESPVRTIENQCQRPRSSSSKPPAKKEAPFDCLYFRGLWQEHPGAFSHEDAGPRSLVLPPRGAGAMPPPRPSTNSWRSPIGRRKSSRSSWCASSIR